MPEPCTIVVASLNRPKQLRACLARLLVLDPAPREIIVVDDGGREPAAAVAAQFGSRVTVIRQDNAGPAAARNRGVEAAETDFIAFTDDDCHPALDWLAHLGAAHAADPEALLGGRVVNDLSSNVCSAASQSIVDFLYQWHAAGNDRLQFFTTNNLGFSRRAFRRVGMLDPGFVFASEDRDLGLRWRATGRPLVYVTEAVVGHRHAMTLREFVSQHANYGRGARRLHVKLGAGGRARLALEPLRFYLGLLSHPLLREDRAPLAPAAAQAALVFLSQFAMAFGYVAERMDAQAEAQGRVRRKQSFVLPRSGAPTIETGRAAERPKLEDPCRAPR